jgi:lipopolysaccharide assembly protein A
VRYVYLILIVVVTGIVLVFNVQNIGFVTVWLFKASMTLPLSVLVIVVYLLGMLTGSSLVSMLRMFLRGARSGRSA